MLAQEDEVDEAEDEDRDGDRIKSLAIPVS